MSLYDSKYKSSLQICNIDFLCPFLGLVKAINWNKKTQQNSNLDPYMKKN